MNASPELRIARLEKRIQILETQRETDNAYASNYFERVQSVSPEKLKNDEDRMRHYQQKIERLQQEHDALR